MRERGARLFLRGAGGPAGSGLNTIVMGEQAAVSFSVLGQQIQLLVVEPMVTIDGPQKYVGTGADAAQAFVVPMKFGTRVTPIKGFGLPSLPENRYPVALVAGDSEAATNADYETIHNGVLVEHEYVKQYLTVEHVDGYVAGASTAQSSNKFLLFTIGPVDVNLVLGLKIASGQSAIAPGRLLAYTDFDGSTVPRTTMQATSAFIDGPWRAHDTGPDDSLIAPFFAEPTGANLSLVSFPPGYLTKTLQNDDHYLQGGDTSVTLTAGLQGVLGLSFGPVQVNLSVTGDISGQVDQMHMLRDAAFAQEPHGTTAGMVPATGVVVRPRTTANATLGPLTGALNMSLDLGLFSASWTVDLFSTGTTSLASYDSDTASSNPWPASSNLRIGTGSSLGTDIRDLPTVDTQLPNGGAFQALPESVSACLTDPKPNPPDAPPCTSQPGPSSAVPSADLCAISPAYVQCPGVGGTSTTLPAPTTYTECAQDIAKYLCGVTGHSGSQSLAVTNSAMLSALGNELKACGTLAAKSGMTQAQTESYLKGLVGFTACDAGEPLNVFGGPSSPSTPPPVTSGGSCH